MVMMVAIVAWGRRAPWCLGWLHDRIDESPVVDRRLRSPVAGMETLSKIAGAGEDGPATRDPDSDVIRLVDAGELREALTVLMRRHGLVVYRYCRDQLGDRALADDVHQQVFIQVYRDLPSFARRSALRSWLIGIARHRVLDAAKSRRRAEAHLDHDDEEDVDVVDPTPPPDERLDRARLERTAIRCLRELGERVRDVLVLRYQRGLEFTELAAIFGGRPDTLRARVARALPALRARVEASGGVGP